MKTPSQVDAMPGEPAAAYQGRLWMFFGIESDIEFKKLFHMYFKQGDVEPASLSRLGQLAAFAGMSLADFARQHSMLGISRVAVAAKDWEPLGSSRGSDDAGYVRSHGMRLHKPQACLCRECVKEDLDRWKFSWFRRSHQIEGIAWCPIHKTRLQTVTARDPWARLPQHWIASEEVSQIPADNNGETEFEARYAEIAMWLIERPAPFVVDALANVLSARAKLLNLRCSRSGRRMNLSDLLKQTAPHEWVGTNWPEVASKERGHYIQGLDRVVAQKNYAQRGVSYLTAMAVLWDSTLKLHQDLMLASLNPSGEEATSKSHARVAGLWQGSVWEEYIRCEGHVGRMASALGIERTHLARRLPEVGLVPLTRNGKSHALQALLRFEAGESLMQACEKEMADPREVEALMRISCSRQALAVRRIQSSRKPKNALAHDRKKSAAKNRVQTETAMPSNVGCA